MLKMIQRGYQLKKVEVAPEPTKKPAAADNSVAAILNRRIALIESEGAGPRPRMRWW